MYPAASTGPVTRVVSLPIVNRPGCLSGCATTDDVIGPVTTARSKGKAMTRMAQPSEHGEILSPDCTPARIATPAISSWHDGWVFADENQDATQVHQLGAVEKQCCHRRSTRGRAAENKEGIGAP